MTENQMDGIAGITLYDVIGRGGFGAVYRGRHHALDIDVAVKIINSKVADSKGLEQTLTEARLMARLDHPNLLRIFHAGHCTDGAYLVLELMDGGSCQGMHGVSREQALLITKQLLSGLQALHDARILHRDIKPANCLHRVQDTRVKLSDLGIATDLTQTTENHGWCGTMPFMAPELFSYPPKYSIASDLYALGVTLSCMFLASDPYPIDNFKLIREWAMIGPKPIISRLRPDLPPSLTGLVDRMMSADPDDRPKSASETLAKLSGIETVTRSFALSKNDSNLLKPLPAETTGVPSDTSEYLPRIGAWELGDVLYSSSNWLGRIATHIHTGKPARIMHLKSTGPLAKQSSFILSSAERASRLQHPNLLEVIDWGSSQGQAYVVTESQGRPLGQLIEDGNPLEEHFAVEFMISLVEALSYVHEAGLVYQLLDPWAAVVSSNARLAQLSWPVYCVQSGSSTTDESGRSQRFLVLGFAAPEILDRTSKTIESSADMYGLGATFCYLVAGKSSYTVARKNGRMPNLREEGVAITAPFADLIARLTHPSPNQRPAPLEVLGELRRIGRNLGIASDSQN
jgi:serine/threonine protein kinase